MAEPGVLYSDIRFKNPKGAEGNHSAVASSSNDTTYSEVRLCKAPHQDPGGSKPAGEPAAGDSPASQRHPGSNGGSKVTPEKVALVVLGVLLTAALLAVGLLHHDNVQTQRALQLLRAEHEAMKMNLTAGPACRTCDAGWESDGGKCYYFSVGKSGWTESREECRNNGGDLVKIDSLQEQKFLEERLKEKMTEDEDKFWIGLTDSREESTWLWVDDSPLDQRLSFWNIKEPDNWTGSGGIDAGEDCVRMGERGGAENSTTWFDAFCDTPHRRICEKEMRRGRVTCV